MKTESTAKTYFGGNVCQRKYLINKNRNTEKRVEKEAEKVTEEETEKWSHIRFLPAFLEFSMFSFCPGFSVEDFCQACK